MKSSKPPALATWLVEHVSPGRRNEALAGDLLEQFSQGRSITWYWRQVLVAILAAFLKEWRILTWAFVFTVGWVYLLKFWSAKFWDARWPIGYYIFVLGIYTAMNAPETLPGGWNIRSVDWRRGWLAIWRPLARGYVATILSTFVLSAFLAARRHPILAGNVVGFLPAFFGLFVMLWSVPRRKGTVKLLRIDPPSNWWFY
jgi:hypothetical protein